MCGSSNSKPTNEENSNVGEVVNSGGFHLLELHIPSVGVSMVTMGLIIGVIILIICCCKKCKFWTSNRHQMPSHNQMSFNPMYPIPTPMASPMYPMFPIATGDMLSIQHQIPQQTRMRYIHDMPPPVPRPRYREERIQELNPEEDHIQEMPVPRDNNA